MATLAIATQFTAQTYWIAVHDHDVTMTNSPNGTGQGGTTTGPGKRYLYWGMTGSGGDTLEIVVKQGGTVLAHVSDVIPGNHDTGGGVAPLNVAVAP